MTKKIGYSKTYPILNIGVWEKIWEEIEVPVEADSRQVWYDIKKKVESFHFESNKADEKKKEKLPFEVEDTSMYGLTTPLEEQIKSCNELKILESYKIIVKGKPALETIYNNRLKELT